MWQVVPDVFQLQRKISLICIIIRLLVGVIFASSPALVHRAQDVEERRRVRLVARENIGGNEKDSADTRRARFSYSVQQDVQSTDTYR